MHKQFTFTLTFKMPPVRWKLSIYGSGHSVGTADGNGYYRNIIHKTEYALQHE
jgi:hypothetical protein